MRTLGATLKFISQCLVFLLQSLYLLLKDAYLLVLIVRDKLEIFPSVVLSIFNTAFGIFRSFMMNYLPAMEISAQCFSYYKAMFKNIMTLICHWVKEIIGIDIDQNVTVRHTSSSSPRTVLCPLVSVQPLAVTYITPQADRVTFINLNPPSLPTIWASKPLEFSVWRYMPYFPTSFNFAQYKHTYIIPDQMALVKGGSL